MDTRQLPARRPDAHGHVVLDDVRYGWERYGDTGPSILLLPSWTIVTTRVWKFQIAQLARRHRVVTFDGAGNGRSDRPLVPSAYRTSRIVDAALAVLDETDTDEAVVLSLSDGARASIELTHRAPERVRGQVFFGPGAPVAPTDDLPAEPAVPDLPRWIHDTDAMVTDFDDYLHRFFSAVLPEPHSSKALEEAVEWGRGTSPEVLLTDMQSMADDTDRETTRAWCEAVTSPSLVVHGTEDRIVPFTVARNLAAVLDAELEVFEGVGHAPNTREPVRSNLLVEEFVARLGPAPSPARDRAGRAATMSTRAWSRGASRRPRALYLSSPIGLGHARRDLAIASELRTLQPDLEIDWLSQSPVTGVLERAGERVHPGSSWLLSESAAFTSSAHGHGLHAFHALRDMNEILLANFHVFQEVVEEGAYDLVIGDEAWDVDHFWHENPELKRGAHVWMTDFVGMVPMASGGDREQLLTSDHNAEMVEHVARYPRMRDRSIFVGAPDDVITDPLGPDLPGTREWTERHFDFAGYVTGFVPPSPDEAAAWREELGYDPDERICIVTVGGSGVGDPVLRRAIEALPLVRRSVPELRMIAVAGPLIDPASLPSVDGLEVRGYVPELHRHLSVADLAVVQGGLTTTMELTAAKRPFISFPLRDHFEQRVHVQHRLRRYGADRAMDLESTDVDALVAEMFDALATPVTYEDVETDGAARAASLIAELL